jgi:4-hydroxyphenylpyruvate dioxygenase
MVGSAHPTSYLLLAGFHGVGAIHELPLPRGKRIPDNRFSRKILRFNPVENLTFMEIDRIYFYVVDAARTLDLLISQMGLRTIEDRTNEHTIEYIIGNAHLSFSISSPIDSSSHVAEYLKLHPSGVKDISFRVDDLDLIRRKIDRLGIKIIATSTDRDEYPWVKIQGWGAIEHTIIQAKSVSINSLADPLQGQIDSTEQIIGIDHIVLNVPVGELDLATDWYGNLFDFQVQQTFDIKTEKSGLASKALVSSCGKIRFNINVPSSGNSQIQEFLDANRGAGIQHIALQTNRILSTIDSLLERLLLRRQTLRVGKACALRLRLRNAKGKASAKADATRTPTVQVRQRMQQQELAFLPIPLTYYVNLQNRARLEGVQPLSHHEWQQLERLQILMDWSNTNPEAVLLQIFTQPIFEAPTFFFEFIERRNLAQGFGEGNFQALFEAIEDYNNLTV